MNIIIIEKGTLNKGFLSDEVCIVTGAGRGIGFETARTLAWLGAKVIVAEIDSKTGVAAEQALSDEFGTGVATFVKTDVSDQESVRALSNMVMSTYGRVDAVINNATMFSFGAVIDVDVSRWDLAYAVNVRGPVLMAQAFLPGMIARDHGCFICVSSSGAAPYMGAYEVFKTAQVELSRVLDGEMEGRKVNVLSIGPGLVRTPGSLEGISALAPLYKKSVEEIYAMSNDVMLTVEEAGAGFAAGVALSERFRGQEISSFAALNAIRIIVGTNETRPVEGLDDAQWSNACELIDKVLTDLEEQYRGWMDMVVFKRQWILRDFKKGSGLPVEQWLEALRSLKKAFALKDTSVVVPLIPPFNRLIDQYAHMKDMLSEYEKDPEKRRVGIATIEEWIRSVESLRTVLSGLAHSP